MSIVGRLVHRVLRDVFFAKVSMNHRLYGVESVSEKLAVCPRLYVVALLKRYGAKIGKGTTFKNNILIDNPDRQWGIAHPYINLQVGDGSYIGKNVYFDLFDQVIIGEKCAISAGVKFITHANPEDEELRKKYPRQESKIVIGNGTWIGANAVILNGVTIGEQCVIGAGAVVLKDVPAHSVALGVPARVVKELRVTKK